MRTETFKFEGYVLEVSNDMEGRSMRRVAYTENEEVAKAFKARSPWNTSRRISINEVKYIIDSLDELDEIDICNKKSAALAKLTEEERKLLGL